MYNLTSPGNKRPTYERGGMRFDLAITDPVNEWSDTQRRLEYTDTYEAQQGTSTYNYHMGFMFPDEFCETPDRFLIHQFKHARPTEDHSPPVSLKVENDVMFFTFRSITTGYDPDEEELGKTQIIRNKWYDFDLSVRWSSKSEEHPFFRVKCNGQTIIDRSNTPTCYRIPGGLVHRIGIYVWDWSNLTKQTIFARL